MMCWLLPSKTRAVLRNTAGIIDEPFTTVAFSNAIFSTDKYVPVLANVTVNWIDATVIADYRCMLYLYSFPGTRRGDVVSTSAQHPHSLNYSIRESNRGRDERFLLFSVTPHVDPPHM